MVKGNKEPATNNMSLLVTLNNAALKNASEEFVTETILHEALHAYFKSLNTSFDHTVMINQYIPWFKSSMQAIYPNMSDADLTALAYGGLLDDSGMFTSTEQGMINAYTMINRSYQTSQSGTPCH